MPGMADSRRRGATFWVSLWFIVLLMCIVGVHALGNAGPALSGTGMTITIATFGVLVTSFSIWLAVRILNRREKWAAWTAIALPIPLYVLGIYPAAWLYFDGDLPDWARGLVKQFYTPLIWLFNNPAALGVLALVSFLVLIVLAVSLSGSAKNDGLRVSRNDVGLKQRPCRDDAGALRQLQEHTGDPRDTSPTSTEPFLPTR